MSEDVDHNNGKLEAKRNTIKPIKRRATRKTLGAIKPKDAASDYSYVRSSYSHVVDPLKVRKSPNFLELNSHRLSDSRKSINGSHLLNNHDQMSVTSSNQNGSRMEDDRSSVSGIFSKHDNLIAVHDTTDYAKEWLKTFTLMKAILLGFGQWPYTITEDTRKKAYIFKFNVKSPGFYVYVWTCFFNLLGLVISTINVIDILMRDKIQPDPSKRTATEIIEQGLVERHTMIVLIMLGSYGINVMTLLFIIKKRESTAKLFTQWSEFLAVSKLHTQTAMKEGTQTYLWTVLINYGIVSLIILCFTIWNVSATFKSGPTVISIMFLRFCMPSDYLDKTSFPNSGLHITLHIIGVILYFYVTFAANVSLYMFLWLLKSVKNAISSWNERLVSSMEMIHQDEDDDDAFERSVVIEVRGRMNFSLLYQDHIGLIKMLNGLNHMYGGILEIWLLFFTVRIVYQIYLAALVLHGNGKPLNQANLGRYFVRKTDYLPAFLITYENVFFVITLLLACSWLEETAYESYDELREVSLLNGPSSDRESFFMLSMFQSYTSTTRAAIYGADYFEISRYSVLHVISAIMSNFLVVYQFRPFFDTDTQNFPLVRAIIGEFLTEFEGLPSDHLIPVSDAVRNKASS